MGLIRKASGAQEPAAPPGGWPGGSWGVVFAEDASGYTVDAQDVLLEESQIPSTYPGGPFTNAAGGSATFGLVAGTGLTFNANHAGTDPRYRGHMILNPTSDWHAYRTTVPAPGNYELYIGACCLHSGAAYGLDWEVNADGGAWVNWITDINYPNAQLCDPQGTLHPTEASWLAAEATAKRAINGVSAYIEWRVRVRNGSYAKVSSFRIYEV